MHSPCAFHQSIGSDATNIVTVTATPNFIDNAERRLLHTAPDPGVAHPQWRSDSRPECAFRHVQIRLTKINIKGDSGGELDNLGADGILPFESL